jgi:hypothetical protein
MCGCLQAINEEESKVSVSDRKVLLVLAKADEAQGHWPRLLKGTGKMANVKVTSPLQLSTRPPSTSPLLLVVTPQLLLLQRTACPRLLDRAQRRCG